MKQVIVGLLLAAGINAYASKSEEWIKSKCVPKAHFLIRTLNELNEVTGRETRTISTELVDVKEPNCGDKCEAFNTSFVARVTDASVYDGKVVNYRTYDLPGKLWGFKDQEPNCMYFEVRFSKGGP